MRDEAGFKALVDQVYEALVGAYDEILAMEKTYDDYVSSGALVEQIEAAMEILENWKRQ